MRLKMEPPLSNPFQLSAAIKIPLLSDAQEALLPLLRGRLPRDGWRFD